MSLNTRPTGTTTATEVAAAVSRPGAALGAAGRENEHSSRVRPAGAGAALTGRAGLTGLA
jgi:hypothetical protein